MTAIRTGWLRKCLAYLVVLSTVHVSPAQAFFCSNCGTEWTQLANYLQLLKQLEKQIVLAEQAIRQTQNMLTNTLTLSTHNWGDALNELRQINKLIAAAKSLSYAAGNLDTQFAKKFSDYQSYAARTLDDTTFAAKYQQWSSDTNASVLTTLKAAGLQSEQIEGSEDVLFRQLEVLAEGAEGRMQALQVGNQITVALARQLQKLRQLVLLQLQLQANYIQQSSDRETAERAAWHNFAKVKPSAQSGKAY